MKKKWIVAAIAACAIVLAGCKDLSEPEPIAVERVTLNVTTLTLTLSHYKTEKLTATVKPDNAADKTVVWLSSNLAVATVGEDGTVTARAEGTATITALAGGKTATCAVTVKPKPIAVESVTLNETTLMIAHGATGKLAATVKPDDADDKTVTWSSSDASVATVSDDGTVTAVKVGTATITATTRDGGKTATCKVTVNPMPVDSITLNPTTLTLTRGETGKLTATVTPDNADNKTVTWSSSDASVATVDNDGTVTAVKVGTATITATTRDGDKTATCTITVSSISVESIALDRETLALTRGKTGKLTATITPDNADNKTVTWSSSDASVATVDNDGTVTAVSKGTATITAQAGGKTATCAVTVNPIPVENVTLNVTTLKLAPNMTKTLTATVNPDDADDKTVTWSSSNPAVATVSNDGTVTAVKVGAATITAQTGDKTATCAVTVKQAVENVALEPTSVTLEPGMTRKLTATVKPDNADDTTVTWSSSDTSVATVDNNGTVTAVKAGEAKITAQAGDKQVTCLVTVRTEHSYSGGKCTVCGAKPKMDNGTIDDNGILTKYSGSEATVAIPDGVTGIGEEAFWNHTSLKSVTIPASVTSIGESAFWECTRLENVTIPDGVTSIGDYAFSDCTNLTSVEIPDSVTSIGSGAFFGCTSLASVTIPDSVTSIAFQAFYGCKSLKSITIPEGVTSIGDRAFMKCSTLTTVTIPASVTSIGSKAFNECNNFRTAYYNGTREDWMKINRSSDTGLLLTVNKITGKDADGNETQWIAQ